MYPALVLLALSAAGPVIPDGAQSDPDQTAESLGVSNVDARSLADDASSFQPRREAPPKTTHGTGWSSLLPDFSLAVRYQTASTLRDTAGGTLGTLPESTVVLVSATWPLQDAAKQLPRQRRWLAQADTPAQPLPRPPPQLEQAPSGPTVQEVQRAAEKASLLHSTDLASLRSRARGSAWLPELTAEYQRNVGNIDMLGIRSGEGVDTSALEDVSRYGVRATWRLSQLVFSPDELRLAATALQLQQARHDLRAEVARIYFERKRLLLRRHLEADPDARKRLTLDIEEHTASLDALTDDWFSKQAHRRSP